MATILLLILAIILPPLAVFLIAGFGKDFWINLLLTILVWVPGVIHAMYLILTRSESAQA